MKRIAVAFPSFLLVVGLMFPAVAAAKPSFKSVTGTVTNGELGPTGARLGFHGGLLVCFVEVGLGSPNVSYIVTADATVTYVCINQGGNNPSAENKGTVAGPVSGTGTFDVTDRGKVEACVAVAPTEPGEFINCTPGMTTFLSEVSYTNVVLTDTTNGVSISVPGTFSRTFPAP